MTKGYYTIFNNISSDEYTEQEKLHSIKDILSLVTHNSITKQSIICAFRWFYDYCLEEAKTPQTNADRIRNMTDEELAEWLHNITQFYEDDDVEQLDPMVSIYDLDKKQEIEVRDSYGDLLEWMRKEVE